MASGGQRLPRQYGVCHGTQLLGRRLGVAVRARGVPRRHGNGGPEGQVVVGAPLGSNRGSGLGARGLGLLKAGMALMGEAWLASGSAWGEGSCFGPRKGFCSAVENFSKSAALCSEVSPRNSANSGEYFN